MKKFYISILRFGVWTVMELTFLSQLEGLTLRVEGGSLDSFEKEIGNGFYHQIKLEHDFHSISLQKNYSPDLEGKKYFQKQKKIKQQLSNHKNFSSDLMKSQKLQTSTAEKRKKVFQEKVLPKWKLNLQGGYFQNQKQFIPALALNFLLHLSTGELEFFLGTLRKNYQDGFLLSNGGYNDFSRSPFWLRSAVGGILHYRHQFFYMDTAYARHLFLYNEQQIFFLGGFKFFDDLIDIYGGYLYDKKSFPLLGIGIGNRHGWFFSTTWNRYTDFHIFLKGYGKNYSLQAGYYQKKYSSASSEFSKQAPEHFSLGFFRDQTTAGYFRLQFFFVSSDGKFNKDYQRFALKIGKENITALKTRGVYFYSRYSSKSASLAGLYFSPPQEKVGFYGGFFWLLPKAGYQIVAGVGMAKIFTLEYIFMENWQKIYAPLNPLAFQSSVSSEMSEETVNYFSKPIQAVVLSLEKSGFSLTLRFVFSWTMPEQTLLSRNILARLAYTKNFDHLLTKE